MERETRLELATPTLARPRYFNYFKAPARILGHSTARRINTLPVLRTGCVPGHPPPPDCGDYPFAAVFSPLTGDSGNIL